MAAIYFYTIRLCSNWVRIFVKINLFRVTKITLLHTKMTENLFVIFAYKSYAYVNFSFRIMCRGRCALCNWVIFSVVRAVAKMHVTIFLRYTTFHFKFDLNSEYVLYWILWTSALGMNALEWHWIWVRHKIAVAICDNQSFFFFCCCYRWRKYVRIYLLTQAHTYLIFEEKWVHFLCHENDTDFSSFLFL